MSKQELSTIVREYKIIDFFTQFHVGVPDFQRPYSWSEENASQLIDDLVGFTADYEQGSDYFLGAIILINPTIPNDRYQIVDGQQRLATITMIFSALRQLGLGNENSAFDSLISTTDVDMTQGSKKFRIILQDSKKDDEDLPTDKQFFSGFVQETGGLARLVQEAPKYESQKLIKHNALLILNRLNELKSDNNETLQRFPSCLLDRCFFAVAQASDFERAYKVFSIINDRGLRLESKDILKPDILSRIDDEKRRNYAAKWEKWEAQIGPRGFEQLLRYISIISTNDRLGKEQFPHSVILKEFRDRGIWGREFIDHVLFPRLRSLFYIQNSSMPEFDETPKAIACTRKINELFNLMLRGKIDHDEWLPVTMLMVEKEGLRLTISDPPPDHAKLLKVLQALEKRAFAFSVLRTTSRGRWECYLSALKELDKGDDLDKILPYLTVSTQESELILRFLDGPLYKKPYCGYVLLSLDRAFAESGVTYDHESITVEHVLPQKATSDWEKSFPDKKQRAELVHKLGNLALLTRRKNSVLQNIPFKEKVKKYFFQDHDVASFVLTNELRNYNAWTPQVIIDRQQKMLEMCKRIWDL